MDFSVDENFRSLYLAIFGNLERSNRRRPRRRSNESVLWFDAEAGKSAK